MNIKDRLVTKRKSLRLTQAEMAEAIEISETAYKKYESGGNPSLDNLIKIADILEISIDELCNRWDTTKDDKLKIRLKKIRLKKISQFDEEEKETISTILEAMIVRHVTKKALQN